MKKISRKLSLQRTTLRALQSNGALVVGGMPTTGYSNPLETCTSEFLSNCGACPWPTDPMSNRCTTW